jgi:NAD(P)-dependent dehydrogenase (short-subunit alcohol dehydrogenase family)
MTSFLKRFRSRVAASPSGGLAPEPEQTDCVETAQLLKGKNVLVTAAGRNVGGGIALEFAAHGANVGCTEKDSVCADLLKEELARFPGRSMSLVSDIADSEKARDLCNTIWSSVGPLDVLVNNAGIKIKSRFIGNEDLDVDWRTTYETNIFGPLSLTRHVCERMIAEHIQGSIIFVSSIHRDSVLGRAHYTSSKAALEMVIKELALELAPHNIRVNAVAPGYVDTDTSGRVVAHRPTPYRRSSIHPKYIGRAAVYLASEYFSRFTTGTVLKVDAGLSLVNYLDLSPKS